MDSGRCRAEMVHDEMHEKSKHERGKVKHKI